jgi:site-specific recombinase XerD
VKETWQKDVVAAYKDNARHLFGYPESTLREYVRDLEDFEEWISCEKTRPSDNSDESTKRKPVASESSEKGGTLSPLLQCGRREVEEYVSSLSARGLRASSINRKIYSLNSFYVWAIHHQILDASPLVGVRRMKVPRRIPKFLTFEDIQRLLTFTGSLRRTSTIRGKQIHAMISTLYYLGLRREELVNICFEHIEKVTDTEIYLHVFGKGDKERLVPFPAPAFQAYADYVRFRPECPCRQVFVSLKNRLPLSKFDVNNVCDQLSRQVKLSKKLTPHILRHTFATHLHLKGQPIEHINALLGHESLNTTKIYVHIDAGRLRSSVEELCKPVARE